jgi:hypothetical protein
MKLHAVYICLLHRCGQSKTIVGISNFGLAVSDIGIERVREIEMFLLAKAGKQIHIRRHLDLIPAHMWNGSTWRYRNNASSHQSEAVVPAMLAAVVKEHLVADTDAKQRFAVQGNLSYHIAQWTQGAYSISESRYAWQDQPRGIFDSLGITAERHLAAYVPKRIAHAPDVAYIVVDNNYHN